MSEKTFEEILHQELRRPIMNPPYLIDVTIRKEDVKIYEQAATKAGHFDIEVIPGAVGGDDIVRTLRITNSADQDRGNFRDFWDSLETLRRSEQS